MKAKHFGYSIDDIGNVTLYHYDRRHTTVYLQGDEASTFLEDVHTIEKQWEKQNPNPGIFNSIDDHIDLIIDPFFYN